MNSTKDLLYVSAQDHRERSSLGVQKKIKGQIVALKKIGFNACLISYLGSDVVLDGKKLDSCDKRSQRKRVLFSSILNELEGEKYRFVYIRHPKTTFGFLKFLNSVSNIRPKPIIVL